MPVVYSPKKEKPEGCKCRWRPWAWIVKEGTIWQCRKCDKKWITIYWSMGSDGSSCWDGYEDYLERQDNYAKRRIERGW